jgi:hypothetical protein
MTTADTQQKIKEEAKAVRERIAALIKDSDEQTRMVRTICIYAGMLTETLIDRVRTEDLDAFEADAKVIEQRAWLAKNRPELSAQVDAAILEAATLEGAE